MFSILINDIDRTSKIQYPGLNKVDNINQRRDKLKFTIKQDSDDEWSPEVNDTIIVTDEDTRIFGGVITSIEKYAELVNYLNFDIECLDWSILLDRRLVNERYENQSVEYIISDILDTYDTGGFTIDIEAEFNIKSIAFNRITISEAVEKLAKTIGYSWYVDYYKQIHFFAKNSEVAPFSLTDTSNNYIWDSLTYRKNLSQIKNSIFVEGGQERSNERTEEFVAIGDDEARRYYRLANKFAEMPVVTVEGAEVTVGAEYLADEATVDCLWSFQEKYIRFTDGNIPATDDVITVTGLPLFDVIIKVQDVDSISTFGLWEYVIRDKNISSRDEAIERGIAELESYKNGLIESEFQTYTSGLRSGQTINIWSTIRGINERFLIQSVQSSAINNDSMMYKVSLATLRTVDLIDLLQGLLRNDEINENVDQTLLSLLEHTDVANVTDVLDPIVTTSPPYYITDSDGNVTTGNPLLVSFGTIE